MGPYCRADASAFISELLDAELLEVSHWHFPTSADGRRVGRSEIVPGRDSKATKIAAGASRAHGHVTERMRGSQPRAGCRLSGRRKEALPAGFPTLFHARITSDGRSGGGITRRFTGGRAVQSRPRTSQAHHTENAPANSLPLLRERKNTLRLRPILLTLPRRKLRIGPVHFRECLCLRRARERCFSTSWFNCESASAGSLNAQAWAIVRKVIE